MRSTCAHASPLQALQTQISCASRSCSSRSTISCTTIWRASTRIPTTRRYSVSQQTPVLASFARVDTETVEKLLSKPWLGSDFSAASGRTGQAAARVGDRASRSFVRGEPLQRVSKQFAERMGVSQSRAATLIHTESAHAAAEATARGYQETGVSEYQFDASLDLKTCSICGAMDGMTFKTSERETGVNYPPVHPRCRARLCRYRV